MMRKLALTLFLLACCALPAAASCSISATAVAFANYTGAVVDVTGTITVNCSSGANYHVGLSGGDSGSVTARTMKNGTTKLNYALTSVSYTGTNWGNTSPTWVTGTGTGRAQTLTVYAKLPAGQYVAPNTYTDTTITVTVSGASFTTRTTTFAVTATVLKDCVVSATNMVFGNYTGAVNNTTSTITVTCTNTATYTVGLNQGTTSGGTVTTRLMAGQGPAAGQTLAYSLTSVSYAGTNWGNTSPTWYSGTGSGVAQPLTVYGQIAAGLLPIPGSYTDTITATVTY
jgi:spore coat protein U-like protein